MPDTDQIAFLNGDYLPISEARISPMDRGFLFGDGIYEVIPSYAGKLVGMQAHLNRMQSGLDAIEIGFKVDDDRFREIAARLIDANGGGNLGIYFHVSRGADVKRFHAFPDNVEPTIFAFAFPISEPGNADPAMVKCLKVATCEDLRWRRCHIKSTSLLGNVLHFQYGNQQGLDESILYNQDGFITEASACNVFVVKNGQIKTPALDHQLLPGVTRKLALAILRDNGMTVEETSISLDELKNADEVWLTSSSKEILPVVNIDGDVVGQGKPGPVWQQAMSCYARCKFDYE